MGIERDHEVANETGINVIQPGAIIDPTFVGHAVVGEFHKRAQAEKPGVLLTSRLVELCTVPDETLPITEVTGDDNA